MKRSSIAFLVAPLWVPLVAAPYASRTLFTAPPQWPWIVLTGLIAAAASYVCMAAIGAPAYLWLRTRPNASFRLAAAIGAAAGGIGWLIFLIGFKSLPMGLLPDLSLMVTTAMNGGWRYRAGMMVLGALIGASFWLIARPDVRSRVGSHSISSWRLAMVMLAGPFALVALCFGLVVAANVGFAIRLPPLN